MNARDVIAGVIRKTDHWQPDSEYTAYQLTEKKAGAIERALHAAGYVVAKLPKVADDHLGMTSWALAHTKGWNACLAAIKANGGKDER